ncbi:MAG: glycosyltransferase [Polyangiaceae bacterium]
MVLTPTRGSQRDDSARLVLLGDGPERAAMEARMPRGRDDVTFAGFEIGRGRQHARRAETCSSCGCPFETFGLGVAEAIAAGLPAGLADQGGAAEQAHGPSVVLYPSGDAEALASPSTRSSRALPTRSARTPG